MAKLLFSSKRKTLMQYKNATVLGKQAILLEAIAALRSLPVSKNPKIVDETTKKRGIIASLINYANLCFQIENQEAFRISAEFKDLTIDKDKRLTEYFAIESNSDACTLKIKKPMNTIPKWAWQRLHEKQIETLNQDATPKHKISVAQISEINIDNPEDKLFKLIKNPLAKDRFDIIPIQIGIPYDEEAKGNNEKLISQAQHLLKKPEGELWDQALNNLGEALKDLPAKLSNQIIREFEQLRDNLAQENLSAEQQEEYFVHFTKTCNELMEGKNPKIKNTIMTIAAVVFGSIFAAIAGFGVGFILGLWTGPGAFFTGALGATVLIINVVGAVGQGGIGGAVTGYGLFTQYDQPKAAIADAVSVIKNLEKETKDDESNDLNL